MKHSSPNTFDRADPLIDLPAVAQPRGQVQSQNAAIDAADGSDVLNVLVVLELSGTSDLAEAPATTYLVLDEVTQAGVERTSGRQVRESRTGKARRRDGKLDKRHRRMTKWIKAGERRKLIAAFWHAKRLRHDLNFNINFHPAYMAAYPAGELGDWFRRDLRNRLACWFSSRGGWFCLWVREAFEDERSEHIHLMVHCGPKASADKLLATIRKWYPGAPQMVTVTPVKWDRHPITGKTYCSGLAYRLKQMSSRAAGPLRPGRPHRQTLNKAGSPVVAVFGEKSGTSKNLSPKAIEVWKAERAIRIRAQQRIQGERALIGQREQEMVEGLSS